jgi:hypothetical protein
MLYVNKKDLGRRPEISERGGGVKDPVTLWSLGETGWEFAISSPVLKVQSECFWLSVCQLYFYIFDFSRKGIQNFTNEGQPFFTKER